MVLLSSCSGLLTVVPAMPGATSPAQLHLLPLLFLQRLSAGVTSAPPAGRRLLQPLHLLRPHLQGVGQELPHQDQDRQTVFDLVLEIHDTSTSQTWSTIWCENRNLTSGHKTCLVEVNKYSWSIVFIWSWSLSLPIFIRIYAKVRLCHK